MNFAIPEIVGLIGLCVGIFGTWYKINKDTDLKIEDHHNRVQEEINRLSAALTIIQGTFVNRADHDRDVERVREEIRSFRNEVRDDLKGLNATLTSRFDVLMQRLSSPEKG